MTGSPAAHGAKGVPGKAEMDAVAIRSACTAFRAAIETTKPRPVGLKDYPQGACGDTSELLADFLRSRGLGDPIYVSGLTKEHDGTHAWLELGDLIIDITADQFEEVHDQVIVSADRSWHEARFPVLNHHRPAGLAHWHGPTHAIVATYYSRLCEALRSDSDAS